MFTDAYSKYKFISATSLPDDVYDELCDDCPCNDSGRIINPVYHPKLKAYMESQGVPTDPVIVWWSW